MSGSGISWAICKSASRSRQITTPVPHHSVFTGRMPFLPPNQQRRSTEGTTFSQNKKCTSVICTNKTAAVVIVWSCLVCIDDVTRSVCSRHSTRHCRQPAVHAGSWCFIDVDRCGQILPTRRCHQCIPQVCDNDELPCDSCHTSTQGLPSRQLQLHAEFVYYSQPGKLTRC